MISVVHLGPHIDTLGGTQSVIRVLRDYSIGADKVRILPTWAGSNHVANARLVAQAAAAIVRLPQSTIVHCHISNGGAWAREGALMALAASRGLPVVATLHGYDFPDFASVHPRVVGFVLTRARHVITLSEDAAQTVTCIVKGASVTIVPNPVAIDASAVSAAMTDPVALFAGEICYRKGVDTLLAAWQIYVDSGGQGRCRIVGSSTDFYPHPSPGLTVEPAVHPSDVRDLIRAARVVVLPSRAEAMPMILTEALASRRPFIATPVGGVLSLTPDTDMLVPVADADALAAALFRYLSDPDVAGRHGDAGLAFISATRSPAAIAPLLRDIYDSVL